MAHIIKLFLVSFSHTAQAAMDNPDLIGGESGYVVDSNPDFLPIFLAAFIMIVFFLMKQK